MNEPTRAPGGDRGHVPVLLREVVGLLSPALRPGAVYVDCTAGLGGHAAALAPLVGDSGVVVLNDADPSNLARAERRVREACASAGVAPEVRTVHGNFVALPGLLEEAGLRADAVLADLGFASTQVDDPGRGFSFRSDGPLDMRLDPALGMTAAEFLASASEEELARVLSEFGEERQARRVARKLVEARRTEPISTTARLAELVRSVVGRAPNAIDPATRTFQALRIAVNDELGSLRAWLDLVAAGAGSAGREGGRGSWLAPGARVAVIAFHSLEDRPVKQGLADMAREGRVRLLTRHPVTPDEDEVRRNPRSRSAKLRVGQVVVDGAGGEPGRVG